MSLNHSEVRKELIKDLLNKENPAFIALGVCGAGMSPLVRLLSNRGVKIVGEDKNIKEIEKITLAKQGIRVYNEGEIDPSGFDGLIYSLAVDENNPTLVKAKAAGIPVMSRAQMLGALVDLYPMSIAVSGSHGKSTVTAMLRSIFKAADKSPTTLCGAPLEGGDGLDVGADELLIYESCEYKDSFLYEEPSVRVVTSVELDHTDYFPDITAIRKSFLKAINRAKRAAVLCVDDPFLKEVAKEGNNRVTTYGSEKSADYSFTDPIADSEGICFTFKGERISLPILGEHNIMNALAALSVACLLGAESGAKYALKGFHGVGGRLQPIGEFLGHPLYLDYAHHPTEIEASVSTLKKLHGKCSVIFKPHTYSRTASLWRGFVNALSLAEQVILTDVYPAREENVYGVRIENLAEEIGRKCIFLKEENRIKDYIKSAEGAIVIMGAAGLEKIKNTLKND